MLYYLHMPASEFGIKGHDTVRAPYDTLEAAVAQAEHNAKTGKQRPVRITDENGQTIREFRR